MSACCFTDSPCGEKLCVSCDNYSFHSVTRMSSWILCASWNAPERRRKNMAKQIVISLLVILLWSPAQARKWQLIEAVDLELILAVDVSRSMNSRRLRLQREGYVAAFRDQEVIGAIQSGPQGRIAVTYVEWSGSDNQTVIVPWRVIGSAEQANAFANDLQHRPTSRTRRTSISAMLNKAQDIFGSSGVRGLRRVVDVSGDGPEQQRTFSCPRPALIWSGLASS